MTELTQKRRISITEPYDRCKDALQNGGEESHG